MIRKLLVANRGEIAGRIIATCQRLGICTVAVYSEADRTAQHLSLANEAVLLGPAAPSASYLNQEAILEAAQVTGADAVHPGYGFLAENADFARRVREAGLVFVGPRAEAMAAMGLKVESRRLCQEAGVPIIPGSEALDDEGLLQWAAKHGYPVMLKASAGGGGKGMRRLESAEALKASLDSARREAERAFGSEALYLEKALVRPRHLEVQVAADDFGGVIHLGARDCSLQRRHQKIIEESPPANLSSDLFTSLTEAAVRLAQRVTYTNLGTVEFLVEDDRLYFLEMNTRLQVEHPVTEAITGLDLVEWQIRLAEGEPLPLAQDQVVFQGHAVEARVACEDPYAGFLPATGTVRDWRTDPRVRTDSLLEPGCEISSHYDSMVAKVIAWGPTRAQALRLLRASLQQTVLLGVPNNLPWLGELLEQKEVQAGSHHTEWVESLSWKRPEPTRFQLLAATVARWVKLSGGRSQDAGIPLELQFEGQPPVSVSGSIFTVEKTPYEVEIEPGALRLNGHRFSVAAASVGQTWWVHTPEGQATFQAVGRLREPEARAAAGTLKAPMPGTVVEVLVQPQQAVTQGQALMKLEAMKMEQLIQSPQDGVVEAVHYNVGEQVEAGAVLLDLSS